MILEFTTTTGQNMLILMQHIISVRHNMSGKTFILVTCGIEYELDDPSGYRFAEARTFLEKLP